MNFSDQYRFTKLITILIFLIVIFNNAFSQSVATTLRIKNNGYEVEVSLVESVYKVKLSEGTDNDFTEKTNYFLFNTFRDIVFRLHDKIQNKKQQSIIPKPKIITPIFISDSDKKSSDTALKSAFLELITELYNTEIKGQKIGEISLKKSLEITNVEDNSFPAKKATQRKENKNAKRINRLYKKERNEILDSIRNREKELVRDRKDLKKDAIITRLNDELITFSTIEESNTKKETKGTSNFEIESARIVFEDGSIRQITVKGTHDQKPKIFSNKFSIGISTRRNIQDFDRINLYQETHVKPKSQSIKLSDVIQYERLVDLRTNDFSPADVTIELDPEETKELFKATSMDLFTLNVFTDLVGFNNDNPNGLVQFEFNKRINLWTRRGDTWLMNYMGIGWFTHMTPSFEITKIEENNRSMKLSSIMDSNNNFTFYLSPLELQRFSFTNITNEINFIDLQGPSVSLHLNLFGGISITDIQDTVVIESKQEIYNENINSLLLGLNAKAIFNPESKWEYQLSYKWTYLDPLSSSFNFGSVENGALKGPNNNLNTWEFLFTRNTSESNSSSSNKLFARFRFTHDWHYWDNNYSEFQIGYSMSLKSSKWKK